MCRSLCAGVKALEGSSRGRGGHREGRHYTGPAARHGRAPSVPAGQRPPSPGPGHQQLFCSKAIGGARRASPWRGTSMPGEGSLPASVNGPALQGGPSTRVGSTMPASLSGARDRPRGCGEAKDDSRSGGSELRGSCRLPGCRAGWVRGSWAGAGRIRVPQAPPGGLRGAEPARRWRQHRAERRPARTPVPPDGGERGPRRPGVRSRRGVGTGPRPRGWTCRAAQRTSNNGPAGPQLVPHPPVSLGSLFFEETEDYIFYREQAVFLIFVSFFRCDFYLCS